MKHFGDIGSQWYKMVDFLIGDNIVKYANIKLRVKTNYNKFGIILKRILFSLQQNS